jgi:hypothetical protein
MPETQSPQVDLTSPDVMKQGFRAVLSRIKHLAEKQPLHDAYLEMFCS